MTETMTQVATRHEEADPVQRMPASYEASGAMTPMAMISQAVTSGAGIETIEKLMSLQERWEANNARKAFDMAISAAKSEIRPIVKNAEVDFTSNKGRTNYKHETLDGIAQQIDPVLSQHGLSYRFRSKQESGQLHVTCIIAHRDGYSEETTLSGPPDQSGSKNAYQAVGSAATYLQRYTLKLALGLSAAKDDDGQSAAPRPEDRAAAFDAEVQAAIRGIQAENSMESLGAFWADLNSRAKAVASDRRVIAAKDDRKAELQQVTNEQPNADLDGDEIPY